MFCKRNITYILICVINNLYHWEQSITFDFSNLETIMTKIFIQFLTIIDKLLLQKMIYKLFISNEKIDIFAYFVLYN